MNLKQLFKKHYSRVLFEAIIRSLMLGLVVGFATNTLCAAAAWFFNFGGIWFPIGVGMGAAAITGFLVYFLKFRPNIREVARRMDTLGLEERTVTMLELKDESSYIAQLQRENATEHIKMVDGRKIRMRISKAVIALAIVTALTGATMTTVVGLAEGGEIPQGPVGGDPDPYENHLSVTYEAGEGGEIDGETDQLVAPGEDTTPVVAVPDDGWVFVRWDDGRTDPERHESAVETDLYYTAIFENIGEGGEGDSEAEGEGGDGSSEGDKAEDIPSGSSSNANSDQQGGKGEEGDASGSEGSSEGGKGQGEEEGEGKGEGQGAGAGGKWAEENMFLDGNTYYRDQLDMYYQYARELFEQNGEIPPELIEFFETYFDSI